MTLQRSHRRVGVHRRVLGAASSMTRSQDRLRQLEARPCELWLPRTVRDVSCDVSS